MFFPRQLTKRRLNAVLLTLLAIHFTLVSYTFPISQLFTALPLFRVDSAYHWYNLVLSANIFDTGVLVGYDPFFDAGRPAGLPFVASAKIPAFIHILLGNAVDTAIVWKLYAFLSPLVSLALFITGLILLGLQRGAIIISAIFGFALLWVSLFRWHHTVGMTSFVLIAFASVFYIGLLIHILEKRNHWLWMIVAGLIGALLELVHPLFVLPVAVGFGVYLLVAWKTVAVKRLLLLSVSCIALVTTVNFFWVSALFADFSYRFPPPHPYQQFVDINMVWKELAGIWGRRAYGSKVYPVIALGMLWALFAYRGGKESLLIRALTGAGVVLIVFAALGASSETVGTFTEPNRFAPVGYLFLAIPAGIGLIHMVATAVDRSQVSWMTWVGRLGCFVAIAAGALIASEIRREASYKNIGHFGQLPPEVRGVGPYTQAMTDWLTSQTTADARILFEMSKARIHDGAHIAGYLAYATEREFIGGPYVERFVTGTSDGRFFDSAIGALSPDRLKQYLELYNIGWIIAHSAEAKRVFDGIPWIEKMQSFEDIALYRVIRDFSYFIRGTGRIVERGHNKLRLADLQGDEIILKYHYMDGLRTNPAVPVLRYTVPDDENAFIRIANPPSALEIFVSPLDR